MLIEINSAPRARRAQSANRLSPRERQAAELAALRNQDIALALGVTLATVKTLISRGMEKTGAETRTQLYAMVTERMAA
jgi:DNA-binding CsgD family transcriptional regulator